MIGSIARKRGQANASFPYQCIRNLSLKHGEPPLRLSAVLPASENIATATHRESPTKLHELCVSVVKKLFDSGVEDQWLK